MKTIDDLHFCATPDCEFHVSCEPYCRHIEIALTNPLTAGLRGHYTRSRSDRHLFRQGDKHVWFCDRCASAIQLVQSL
ncbi:hypothetical protein [Pantanalinema sp. GBBB05]|uniref:hypothetical protein n=1 Tax=Pantanalinema sp. GBBB05 TaxID=2604139 RepID=UPI001DDCBDCD|nr:hypothetical protein [Pantanalinema sp. GBBB05]